MLSTKFSLLYTNGQYTQVLAPYLRGLRLRVSPPFSFCEKYYLEFRTKQIKTPWALQSVVRLLRLRFRLRFLFFFNMIIALMRGNRECQESDEIPRALVLVVVVRGFPTGKAREMRISGSPKPTSLLFFCRRQGTLPKPSEQANAAILHVYIYVGARGEEREIKEEKLKFVSHTYIPYKTKKKSPSIYYVLSNNPHFPTTKHRST